jgi:hypothetical protein
MLIIRLVGFFIYFFILLSNQVIHSLGLVDSRLKEFDILSCIGLPVFSFFFYLYIAGRLFASVYLSKNYEWVLSEHSGYPNIDVPYTLTPYRFTNSFNEEVVSIKKKHNKRIIESLNDKRKFKIVYIKQKKQ